MTRLALLAALLCAGCPTGSGYGLTPIWSREPGHTSNARAPCIADPTLLPLADLALVLIAREAVAAGFDYEAVAAAVKRVPPVVCLVAKPEPCCIGSICQVDTDGVTRPKAGCASLGFAWVSREWPVGTVRDWRGDLLHELSHVVAFALLVDQRPDHAVAWAQVEARALKAFLDALE